MATIPVPDVPPESASPAEGAGFYRWYVLGLLTIVYALSSVDRQLPFVLAEPIKRDLDLTDGELGLVGGIAYSLFYTLLCLPVAHLADRTSRKWVLTISLVVWSLTTAAAGFTRNFGQMFLARVGLGIGEAGCSAPSHSLIADYFGLGLRATALSIFSVGATLGAAISFALGAMLGELYGWRTTYLLFGGFGAVLALAVVSWTLKEVPRQMPASGEARPRLLPVAVRMLRQSTFRNMCIGAGLHALTFTTLTAWMSPLFTRVHGFSVAEAGLAVGMMAGGGGTIGVVAGGLICDRLATRDRRWQLWAPAISIVLSLPLALLGLAASSPMLAIAAFAPAIALSTIYAGPVFATAQDLARPNERATAAAIIVLTMGVLGVGAGPALTGYLSDGLNASFGHESLRPALIITTLLDIPAFLLFYHAQRTFVRDLEQPS